MSVLRNRHTSFSSALLVPVLSLSLFKCEVLMKIYGYCLRRTHVHSLTGRLCAYRSKNINFFEKWHWLNKRKNGKNEERQGNTLRGRTDKSKRICKKTYPKAQYEFVWYRAHKLTLFFSHRPQLKHSRTTKTKRNTNWTRAKHKHKAYGTSTITIASTQYHKGEFISTLSFDAFKRKSDRAHSVCVCVICFVT